MKQNQIKFLFLSLFLIDSYGLLLAYPQLMQVVVSVADLREKPEQVDPAMCVPTSQEINPLQQTQLLFNEWVIAHEEAVADDGTVWVRVNAPLQQFFTHELGWHGYPGWVLKDALVVIDEVELYNLVVNATMTHLVDYNNKVIMPLSIGTRLFGIPARRDGFWFTVCPDGSCAYVSCLDVLEMTDEVEKSVDELRRAFIDKAFEFIGCLYVWGGRVDNEKSFQNPAFGVISGVDCSGLVSLSMLALGLQIPRMSHEQFLRSAHIECSKDLLPGDLIFFASLSKQFPRMDHVMMYVGDNMILESTSAGEQVVRVISFEQRMGGCSINDMTSGDVIDDGQDTYVVYFGSFFTGDLQQLRDDAMYFVRD